MKKKLTSPQLLKQAQEFVSKIPNAELDHAAVIDVDTIRIWYRDKTTKALACRLQPWKKSGAVTFHDFKKTQLLPIIPEICPVPQKYVPGDEVTQYSSGYCGDIDEFYRSEHTANDTDKTLVKGKKKMEI